MRRRPAVVRGRPGLLGTAARTAVVAGTATATSNAISNRHNRHQQAAAQEPPAPAPAPAPAAGQADLMTRLKELADMKAAGILTDEEFAAAKAKILG